MDMTEYFHSFGSDAEIGPEFIIELDEEPQLSAPTQYELLLLRIILLALDDLTSRKRHHQLSAIHFFKSTQFDYYLSLLGINKNARNRIIDHIEELLPETDEHELLENGVEWCIGKINHEVPVEPEFEKPEKPRAAHTPRSTRRRSTTIHRMVQLEVDFSHFHA